MALLNKAREKSICNIIVIYYNIIMCNASGKQP